LSAIKKIIYVGYVPLTFKVAADFFITDLASAGTVVEYWDCSHFFFGNLKINGAMEGDWIIKVGGISHFKSLLKDLDVKEVVFFINFPYNGKVIRLFRLFTVKNLKIFIIARGILPVPGKTVKKSILKLFEPGMFRKGIDFGLNKVALILKKIKYIKSFDRIYFAGDAAINIAGVGYKKDTVKSELVCINSSDYDRYLNLSTEKLIEDRYVVFLDEYLPYHPDVKMFGLVTVEAEDYYNSLNKYFDDVEKRYNVIVVIAAHPKAELYQNNNFYNNRQVIFNKSVELINSAEFVLGHSSTSISFAVLSKKPIIFLYTQYMKENMAYYFDGIYHFANFLNSSLVDITENMDSKSEVPKYDEVCYQEFKYRYLTSEETENKVSKDIFLNSVQS